jgi:hypothetical protein
LKSRTVNARLGLVVMVMVVIRYECCVLAFHRQ